MTKKPLKPCKYLGCPELTSDGCCDKHKKSYHYKQESASKRGYDSKWRKARNRYLKENPLCIYCKEEKSEDFSFPHHRLYCERTYKERTEAPEETFGKLPYRRGQIARSSVG